MVATTAGGGRGRSPRPIPALGCARNPPSGMGTCLGFAPGGDGRGKQAGLSLKIGGH